MEPEISQVQHAALALGIGRPIFCFILACIRALTGACRRPPHTPDQENHRA